MSQQVSLEPDGKLRVGGRCVDWLEGRAELVAARSCEAVGSSWVRRGVTTPPEFALLSNRSQAEWPSVSLAG